MDHTVPFGFSGYSGLDVGRDNGLVVDRSYADKAPFAFTGTVKKVVFDVAPHLDADDELALHEHAQQATPSVASTPSDHESAARRQP